MTNPLVRIAALVLALAALGGALAQGDAPAEGETLAAAIAAHPELGRFAGLIEESGLADQLDRPVRLTVFAPNDAAFEALGEEALASLLRDVGSTDVVLRHHLVRGRVPPEALAGFDVITTLEGTRLAVRTEGERILVEGARAGEGTPVGEGGMLYVVDALLLPEAANMIKDLQHGGPRR